MSNTCIQIILLALTAIFTGTIAWFTFKVHQTYKRIAFLTGALESHSTLQTRLVAMKEGIPLVWWDPNQETFPSEGPHGSDASVKRIHVGMHPDLRKPGNKKKRIRPLEWDNPVKR